MSHQVTTQALRKAFERALRTNELDPVIKELEHLLASANPVLKFLTKAANFTLTAADNTAVVICTAAVAMTLPAPQEGLTFRCIQTADADMSITGNANLIHKGTVTGTSVAFMTAAQKRGSHALIECINVNGTLKWLVSNLGGTTATVV